jgi:hypothetical protein
MTFALLETIALESVSVNEDGSRRVRLISPGQGSSGYYSREVLAKYTAEALPKGTLVYLDHMSDEEFQEGRGRSIKDIAGKLLTDPVYEADAPEGEGSYTNIKFTESVEPLIKDVLDVIAVSVEVHAGKKDSKGNIVEMHADPLNSLAVVPVGGRDGRIFESFRAKAQEDHDNGGSDMTISAEDRKAIVDDLLPALTEALKPKPAEEQEPVVVDHAAVVEAVVTAKLPKELISSVVTLVESGKSVEDAIKEQTALVEAIRGEKADDDDAEHVLSEGVNGTKDKADIKSMTPEARAEAYMEKFISKKGGKA